METEGAVGGEMQDKLLFPWAQAHLGSWTAPPGPLPLHPRWVHSFVPNAAVKHPWGAAVEAESLRHQGKF